MAEATKAENLFVRKPLTQERLRELLCYDPDTGVLTWLPRDVRVGKEQADKCWNTRYAGKNAGTHHYNGYIHVRIYGKSYGAHRLIFLMMSGRWPAPLCDHRDLDGSNNRWSNLREATFSQNGFNEALRENNTSGFKGVIWNKRDRKWVTQIRSHGRKRHLGNFDTAQEARETYQLAAIERHGAFARLK